MHNRFRATLSCAAIALAALTTTPARAQVTRAFDGAATGTYPQGAGIDFFELGNFMQETFSGVGLASVNALNVDFRFQSNLTSSVAANRTMSFSVFLNGTAVGSLASTLFPIQPTAGNVLLSFVGFGNVNASGGNYTVTPGKPNLVPAGAGINTVDVLGVQRHFLNISFLTGCALTAGDANGDASITTIDVIAIQRFYLGFAAGTANAGIYQFTPSNRNYPGVTTSQTSQNYSTIVFGDIAAPFVE